MTFQTITKNGVSCAVVHSDTVLIFDVDSALDCIATVQYQTGCNRIVLSAAALAPDFFVLSTRLAGEILQKFVQYHVALAIVGDFSQYTSKPLQDFIYESNKGRHIFFASSQDMAVDFLTTR